MLGFTALFAIVAFLVQLLSGNVGVGEALWLLASVLLGLSAAILWRDDSRDAGA